MTPHPPPLRRAQLDALLAFLPIFAQPGYIFGEWHADPGVLPFWSQSPEVAEFIQVLYHQQFLITFDWVTWAAEAQHYDEDGGAALATADLDTLRKLMTAFVRADRFSEGTLAARFQSGQITAILRRLQQIRETMAAT
ncbi:MAG: hypothetical protein EOM24_30825 [Chloroflexia bacterium]|nr:hypothetical protein [Chloroflexia bacterium]